VIEVFKILHHVYDSDVCGCILKLSDNKKTRSLIETTRTLITIGRQEIHFCHASCKAVCLQLLEILEISWNFIVAAGKIYNSVLYFAVCQSIMSETCVFTGYRSIGWS